jgi:Zn-dependent peptidase ImmA (M78 family)/DNA-binding XRE family transcriptional regulator
MSKIVNSEMVVLARESRGLTQKELAKRLDITQGHMSKIENNLLGVSPEMLSELVRILKYPEDFFYQTFQIFPPEMHFYRMHKTLSAKKQNEILAMMNIRRKHIQEFLDEAEIEFEKLPECDLDEYKTPEDVARAIRHFLRLPRGVVKNMTEIMENAGIIIIHLDVDTRMFSGCSMHAENPNFIVFVNKNMPGDRLRFTLAHELGHIVMHRLPTPNMEEEADRFAAEFLMPAMEIAQYLSDLALDKLASLKRHWKVSMAAILQHAKRLGKISQRQYEYLWTLMGKAGYRLKEPPELDVPQEQSSLLAQIVDLHVKEMGYTIEQIAKKLAFTVEEFNSIYLAPTKHLRLLQRVV